VAEGNGPRIKRKSKPKEDIEGKLSEDSVRRIKKKMVSPEKGRRSPA
jgi:hypothetical protein